MLVVYKCRFWLSSLKQSSDFINSLSRLTLLKITPSYITHSHTRTRSHAHTFTHAHSFILLLLRFWLSSLKQSSHFINSLSRLTLLKITPLLYHTLTHSHTLTRSHVHTRTLVYTPTTPVLAQFIKTKLTLH